MDDFFRAIGLDRSPMTHRTSLLAGLGTLLGILMVGLASRSVLGVRAPSILRGARPR